MYLLPMDVHPSAFLNCTLMHLSKYSRNQYDGGKVEGRTKERKGKKKMEGREGGKEGKIPTTESIYLRS